MLLFSHKIMYNSLWSCGLQPCQAPLSMGFSSQEQWSGLRSPSPGDLPDPGIKPVSPSPTWPEDSLPWSHLGSPFSRWLTYSHGLKTWSLHPHQTSSWALPFLLPLLQIPWSTKPFSLSEASHWAFLKGSCLFCGIVLSSTIATSTYTIKHFKCG